MIKLIMSEAITKSEVSVRVAPEQARQAVGLGWGHAINNRMVGISGYVGFKDLGFSDEYDHLNASFGFLTKIRPEKVLPADDLGKITEQIVREEARRWVDLCLGKIRETGDEKSESEEIWQKWEDKINNDINQLKGNDEKLVGNIKSEAKKVLFVVKRLRNIAEGGEVLPPSEPHPLGGRYFVFLDGFDKK